MDTATFYATTSAVSFTLLGFWWVVVQFRHDEMTQDPGRRRLAFVVSLHFILPGLMSLGALLTADEPIVWRLTFGLAGVAGMAAVVVASRGVEGADGRHRGDRQGRVDRAAPLRHPDARRPPAGPRPAHDRTCPAPGRGRRDDPAGLLRDRVRLGVVHRAARTGVDIG